VVAAKSTGLIMPRSGFPTLGGGDGPTVQEQVQALWFDLVGTPFPRQVPALVAMVGTAPHR
jgi:hypothetical protein